MSAFQKPYDFLFFKKLFKSGIVFILMSVGGGYQGRGREQAGD